jgi:hypothetical protein
MPERLFNLLGSLEGLSFQTPLSAATSNDDG